MRPYRRIESYAKWFRVVGPRRVDSTLLANEQLTSQGGEGCLRSCSCVWPQWPGSPARGWSGRRRPTVAAPVRNAAFLVRPAVNQSRKQTAATQAQNVATPAHRVVPSVAMRGPVVALKAQPVAKLARSRRAVALRVPLAAILRKRAVAAKRRPQKPKAVVAQRNDMESHDIAC